MRRVFFSFHCEEDLGRADVIFRSWQAHHRDSTQAPSFLDSRVWEKATANGDESVKHLIREGVEQTSVTCVLAGAHTWERRWVRYEIARSLSQGSGLFSVRINGIADAKTRQTSAAGWNPLAYVGIGKVKGGAYVIYENVSGQWMRYQEHTASIARPRYLADMSVGYVQPVSTGLLEYDYVRQNGPENLAGWVDLAAQRAGK